MEEKIKIEAEKGAGREIEDIHIMKEEEHLRHSQKAEGKRTAGVGRIQDEEWNNREATRTTLGGEKTMEAYRITTNIEGRSQKREE